MDVIAKEKIFEDTLEIEPSYCTLFGCGKKLSLIESLCGARCMRHQSEEKDIMDCISV